jgi:hypothetical protein
VSHAELSPSSAHRWIACPRSVVLSRGKPSTTSAFAAEGTLAHSLAERVLRHREDHTCLLGTKHSVDGYEITVSEEMIDAISLYVQTVDAYPQGPGVEVHTELKVKLNDDVWGTADCVIWDGDARHLTVIDLKYGKGVQVDADDNEQMMIYALAAANTRGLAPKTVCCMIVQPRVSNPVKKTSFEYLDLLIWEEMTLAPAMQAVSDPFTKLNVGNHCRFCPAKPDCPELRGEVLKAAQMEFAETPPEPSTLTSEALGKILDKAELIAAWVSAVRAEASGRIDRGEAVPGWKLVPKRAMRKWFGPQAVDEIKNALGLNDADVYDYEPRTVSQIEKLVNSLLGKGEFTERFGSLVVKESSGTTLAPTDDPRQAVPAGPKTDFEEV